MLELVGKKGLARCNFNYMRRIKDFSYFLMVIYQQRYIIRKLVIRDFQKKYLGSYLGLIWAFLHPLAFILAIWFVVSIGLRGGDRDGVAFLPWFVSAMIPWFFIRDAWNNAAGSLMEYAFLIKKMYFRVGIIPIIKITSILIIHAFLLAILIIVLIFFGFSPSIYWLQIPYYLMGSLTLVVGLAWLTSALTVFIPDIKQVVNVCTTLLFWLSAIIWPHERLEGNMRYLADLNPFFYVTNGFRETLIYEKWFFEQPLLMLYFWSVAFISFVTGAFVFQKLKPHFADVL